jgi:hypothetical protein
MTGGNFGLKSGARPMPLLLLVCLLTVPQASLAAENPWNALLAQAQALALPTQFLSVISPGFVTLEFENLQTYAAEYHPQEHRMVLNRALSFNAAGSVLQPLSKLPHRDLGTLYHELFHAYLDFLRSNTAVVTDREAVRLLSFARQLQQCRYQVVQITPVVQRRSLTEQRILSEREAWEALDETWAVFVGWTVWTRLELAGGAGNPWRRGTEAETRWLQRLKKADRQGDLTGYFEPEDPAERNMTHKRYLAPAFRISPKEAALLLEVILGDSTEEAKRATSMIGSSPPPVTTGISCPGEPTS